MEIDRWQILGAGEEISTRSNLELGNEGLCAANFLIKEQRTTSTACSDSDSTRLTAQRGSGVRPQYNTAERWETRLSPEGPTQPAWDPLAYTFESFNNHYTASLICLNLTLMLITNQVSRLKMKGSMNGSSNWHFFAYSVVFAKKMKWI